jgi:CRISPR/Cas system CSM-associated protein Csm3 (group 7 of RAMP superfamily)
MQPLRVEVIRESPRPRDRITGLCGSIEASIRACAKRLNDPFDSYLHVGTGTLRFKIGLSEGEMWSLLKRFGLERTAYLYSQEIVKGIDFSQMPSSQDRPIIPGSTVKGNVRARLELSFRAIDGKVRVCFVRASKPESAALRKAWRHRKIWGDVLRENRGPCCDHTKGRPVCLLCDVFGATGLAGLVSFEDFTDRDVVLEQIEGEYGIKLMAAPPGSEFIGSIHFTNLREEELGLLMLGMGLDGSKEGRPVLLGRLRYVGKIGGKTIGRVRYSIRRLVLSPLSQPYQDLNPGSSAEGDILDQLVGSLSSKARDIFGRELDLVDEVKALESL